MGCPTNISVVTADEALAAVVRNGLEGQECQLSCFSSIDGILGYFYSDPPELLIVDLTSERSISEAIVKTLRDDIFFSTMPVIAIVNCQSCTAITWQQWPIDDFITLPLNTREFLCRLALAQSRIRRIFDNNPLTRLPGNTSIQRAINDAMGKPLAVCYLDINNFKPYNDCFGFAHGDEVLRMLARIMFNAVRDSGGGFCGHVGGDDFVCIIPVEKAENVCQTIIDHYDHVVSELFDDHIKTQGYYVATNRRGEMEHIPMLSISIAVVPTDSPKITHAAKVVEVAAELKALAKDSVKSRYVIDSRRG
ncbi:MAG TPA: diguanylate cyclase [Deltaproteobacteria bacterium]|nr:diguanylate cyclase [Deltaproteobacteria bacterium]HQB39178.1 diguanylate cyclase [Deltaproteobacteria bacterium]